MSTQKFRAEILVNGLVQGVGFRYYVYRHAQELGLNGFTKNLYSGEVYTVVEGDKHIIEEFYKLLRVGPSYAHVNSASVRWREWKNEFTNFEITY